MNFTRGYPAGHLTQDRYLCLRLKSKPLKQYFLVVLFKICKMALAFIDQTL